MRPLPGLRGRVVAGGEPLAGVQVRLYAEADAGVHMGQNGLEVTVDPTWLDQDHSDDEGRFLLTPRASGRYLVRAERDGFAPTELGPIEVDPAARECRAGRSSSARAARSRAACGCRPDPTPAGASSASRAATPTRARSARARTDRSASST